MAFTIIIRAKGLDNLPQKLRKIKLGINSRMAMMLDQIGAQVETIATEDYLSGPRPQKLGRVSGDLARSITHKIIGNRVVIGSNLVYARIHELGGTIRAKTAPYLHFKVGDRWVSTKEVTIPERPFLHPALKDAIPGARRIIARLAAEAVKEAMA